MSSTVDPDSDLVGGVAGLAAFLCRPSAAGGWEFTCTCRRVHRHRPGEGRRAAHCDDHDAYYLLPPEDEGADQ